MIKLQDIEALLNVNEQLDADFYNVPDDTINEVSRVYGAEVKESKVNKALHISSGSVAITLNTMQKTWK